jgi:hypothetical protein
MGHPSKRHGHRGSGPSTESITYTSWRSMRDRCRRPSCNSHEYYSGDRLVRIPDRWRDFANFLADMGERPSKEHTLERRHPWSDYGPPPLCCWATRKQQANNTRNKCKIQVMGVTGTMAHICRKTGLKEEDVHRIMRLNSERANG